MKINHMLFIQKQGLYKGSSGIPNWAISEKMAKQEDNIEISILAGESMTFRQGLTQSDAYEPTVQCAQVG